MGSHGVLAGRVGFHMGSWQAGGVSHGVLAGRVEFHMGSLLGGWGFHIGVLAGRFGVSRRLEFHMGRLGFHLGFCRAVGGFLEFAVTLNLRPRDPKSSTQKS